MKISYLLFFIVLAFSISSCKQHQNQKHSTIKDRDKSFFDPFTLGRSSQSEKFIISTRFCECGEWGGHEEEVIVYSDSNLIIYGKHIIYNYNCDSAMSHGYSPRLGVKSSKIVELSKYKRDCIVNFLHTLLNAKIGQFPILGHATNRYTAVLKDSTLIISVGDISDSLENNYKELISDIF